MQTIRITTSQNIDIEYEMGGLGERIVAALIDVGIFFLIYMMALIAGVSAHAIDSAPGMIIMVSIYAALYVFYDLVCEVFMNGQSIGKKVMKIRVMSLDGAQPRFTQYLMRWLFRIIDCGISFYTVGLVVAAISDKGQRIGDLVAGTILVRTVPRVDSRHIAFMPAEEGYEPTYLNATELSEQDIELISEVIVNYTKTKNSVVVHNMATRIKEHLGIAPLENMNSLQFLQVILKDYSYLIAQDEAL